MKFLFIFIGLFLSTLLFSQAPQGINYQAVMRNSSGNLVTNSTVAIRVQIRQGSATGTTVYQERQSVASSSQGLINMVIGAGTPQVGTFNNINWAVGPFFVNLGVDFSNGVNYQDFGTQQLMSVPYALYAKTSGAQLNQWRYGNTVPVNTLGVLGDFYLDVVTGNVYYKNSTTTWVLTGNIKGPVGPSGATGATGAQGIQGIQGATGAQGIQGIQGVAGTNGTNGTNGKNTLVKTTTETAGANCTTGGIKIEYGLDANNNGTLDLSEINASLTKYVCNGAVGATGATGAQGPQGIQGVAGPTGATGAQGPIGLTGPAGATGTQGAQGPAGTNGTNGTNGADGKNTLVKTTNESAGANCTTGGVKIEYGLDANNNGTLDVSEVNASLTKYVCNGAVGPTGAQGPQGIQGVAGPTGATGAQGPIGLTGPAGATGAQGAQGPAGTNGTNGTNGVDGKNTLAKTTNESAGANCTTGGVKIEYGLDANNNGTLDVSEVNASLTKYVCNGAVGPTGAQGPQGIQGVAGPTGATGAQGPIGLTGPTGATGTQGAQGPAGTNGTNGTNGADGKNTLAKTTNEAAGANCTTGGVKIEYGLDANNNGTLDVSEVNATLTKYVCNGAVGAIGSTGAQGPQGIQGVAGPTGATGAQGPIGLTGPAGATGTQGAQGPTGTNGTNGTNGVDGKNTLVKTTTEAAGANCTTGGVKIEYGLDANNNGTLDVSEINATLTRYVCNGATGVQGIQGVPGTNGTNGAQGIQGVAGTNGTDGKNTLAKTTTEAAGANCTTGGVKIEYGLDANNNGTLDVSEVNATLTKYVCNGATGAQGIQGVAGANGTNGLNALIKTTTEPAGANCTNGGTKIETGLDANGNGVLDVGEENASQTKYVCNGINGITSGNLISIHGSFSLSSGADSIWIIPNGVSLLEIDLRGGNGSSGQTKSICGFNQMGPAWGGPGGNGASCVILLAVSTGDVLHFYSGQNAIPPPNYTQNNNCTNFGGQQGNPGTPSYFSVNGTTVVSANGGIGGNGYHCLCGSGTAPAASGATGVISGPAQNSGGILLNQGTLGGGIITVRF